MRPLIIAQEIHMDDRQPRVKSTPAPICTTSLITVPTKSREIMNFNSFMRFSPLRTPFTEIIESAKELQKKEKDDAQCSQKMEAPPCSARFQARSQSAFSLAINWPRKNGSSRGRDAARVDVHPGTASRQERFFTCSGKPLASTSFTASQSNMIRNFFCLRSRKPKEGTAHRTP